MPADGGQTLSGAGEAEWLSVFRSRTKTISRSSFLKRLGSTSRCAMLLQEYRTSTIPFSDFWQCGAESHDNFGDSAYTPSERVIDKLTLLSGVPLRTWARLHLHSGRGSGRGVPGGNNPERVNMQRIVLCPGGNESDALYGKWCGLSAYFAEAICTCSAMPINQMALLPRTVHCFSFVLPNRIALDSGRVYPTRRL